MWSAVNDLQYLEGFQDEMELPVRLAMESFMHHIEREQPYGHEEEGYPQRSVSKRVGHIKISDGWRQQVEPTEKGVRIDLRNASEHFKWYVEPTTGADPLSGNPKLAFWWGDPHPWPAPEVSYRGEPMGPGWYVFRSVSHPGTQANPFVHRVKEQARPDMTTFIKAGIANYIDHTFRRAGLRRKRKR